MKTLVLGAFSVSFVATAAVCAMAGEGAKAPTAKVYAGPASITLPLSVLAEAPPTADLKPSLEGEEPSRRPVRVVLASPYAVR